MKTFLEAVIDIPRRTYAKGVFDEADTDNPKLKDSVKSMIDNILTKIEDAEGYSILKTGLIVSSSALIFQELIGHWVGGDIPSRVEAIPNAILYAKYFSLHHLFY